MTPLLAMAQQLARDGADFALCVFARSREHLAFAAALAVQPLADHVQFHFDDPAASEKIDLRNLLAQRSDGTHLYMCGPAGFMEAAQKAAEGWPDDVVHKEYFAPPQTDTDGPANEPFELRLARRNITAH